MRTMTVRNLSAPQLAAFAELFPVLSSATTVGGTPLVAAKGATAVIVALHPKVVGPFDTDAATVGPRLARAAVRLFLDRRPAGIKRATVQALAAKLDSSTPDAV